MILIDCEYFEPHIHQYSEDWKFDGANGLDPRADPRFQPTTYLYYDEHLNQIHLTQVPLCDQQAIDEFTRVNNFGPAFKPVYLAVQRPGERKPDMLPLKYDPTTDEVDDL